MVAGIPPDPFPLELSPELMHQLVAEAGRRLVDHIVSLPGQPASYLAGTTAEAGREAARTQREPLPEEGSPLAPLLDQLFEEWVPVSLNTAGPGYLAYIPGGGLFPSAVADLIAGAVNRYVGVWAAAPALAELEANVIRWFCRMVGYPPEARGFLTTGGSLANLTAVVTARRERLPESFLGGTLYASDQVHHSVVKAAVLAGFPAAQVRRILADEHFRLPLGPLAEAVARDRRAGFSPFLVVGSAGTTNTGAVDNLVALADFAADEGLWLHVDGAYGGFFTLTARGREVLAGLDRADSVTLDPHKGLFLPYGTGSLLVRDGQALRRTHSVRADYMPPIEDSGEFTDFCEISPELSRGFRGLRVWLPMKLHGAGAFRAALDEKLDLARWATAELRRMPGVEILAEPQLSIVAFRLHPTGLTDGDELDGLNRRFLTAINARGRVYMTGTLLRGAFALRISVLSFRTHRERMEMALEDIRSAAAEVLGSPAGG